MTIKKPITKEAQLEILLGCLYDEFTSRHGAIISKLDEHLFYVTNRMSCAKAADLNYMYPANSDDGRIVQVHNSSYVDAMKTLEQMGFVKRASNASLAFNLTKLGYDKIHEERMKPVLPTSRKILEFLNKNPAATKILIAVSTGIFGLILYFIKQL